MGRVIRDVCVCVCGLRETHGEGELKEEAAKGLLQCVKQGENGEMTE